MLAIQHLSPHPGVFELLYGLILCLRVRLKLEIINNHSNLISIRHNRPEILAAYLLFHLTKHAHRLTAVKIQI
jgi:hypothetical protein